MLNRLADYPSVQVNITREGCTLSLPESNGFFCSFDSPCDHLIRSLIEYSKGIPCHVSIQGSPFEEAVWVTLSAIPFGCTMTYGEIARKIGKPLGNSLSRRFANISSRLNDSQIERYVIKRKRDQESFQDGRKSGEDSRNGVSQRLLARAVGQACGRNPMPLFIPCHRAVANSSIGGFAFDIEIKKRLLNFEEKMGQKKFFPAPHER